MTEHSHLPRRSARRTTAIVLGIVGTAVALGLVAVLLVGSPGPSEPAGEPVRATPSHAAAVPSETAAAKPSPPELDDEVIAALPAAVYDAVIPELLAYDTTDIEGIDRVYTSVTDVPVFGNDLRQPIARIPALNFLDEPTTIVPVAIDGEWALVLTPARQNLPSQSGGAAAAQSAGWVPLRTLDGGEELTSRIIISVSRQTLTIQTGDESLEFAVGVGTEGTPTPTGTAGYIQARYNDPSQADYTIQLTTLHSAAADEPFGGSDGGLIGMHYNLTNTGAVSHGCVRLPYDALLAVDEVPLGTPVVFVE